MAQAKEGDTVKVHYSGSLENGDIFDSTEGQEPLQFTLGEEMVIPGFEDAVIGLSVGETKKTLIPSDEAYGPYMDDFIIEIDRSEIPEGITPEVGMMLQATSDDGDVMDVAIIAVDDDHITLDGNHPLAGKDLTFEITLVEIV